MTETHTVAERVAAVEGFYSRQWLNRAKAMYSVGQSFTISLGEGLAVLEYIRHAAGPDGEDYVAPAWYREAEAG